MAFASSISCMSNQVQFASSCTKYIRWCVIDYHNNSNVNAVGYILEYSWRKEME